MKWIITVEDKNNHVETAIKVFTETFKGMKGVFVKAEKVGHFDPPV